MTRHRDYPVNGAEFESVPHFKKLNEQWKSDVS